jgi:4-aminobutyrate aminotransferase-like enzyme
VFLHPTYHAFLPSLGIIRIPYSKIFIILVNLWLKAVDFALKERKVNKTMIEEDLQHIWHPCTQMKDHEWLPLIPIKSGRGIYLFDFEGNRYIDAISSWWVNIFGHANPRINQKIKEQIN